jgi:hypothetical protein
VIDLRINAPKTVTQALPSRVYTHDAGRPRSRSKSAIRRPGCCWGVSSTIASPAIGEGPGAQDHDDLFERFDFESLFGLWAGAASTSSGRSRRWR